MAPGGFRYCPQRRTSRGPCRAHPDNKRATIAGMTPSIRRRTTFGAGLVTLVLVLSAGGCDKQNEPFKDAPRTGTDNGAPADTVRMPDGFSNLATKCDHGNRIYVAYHGDNTYASIFVVKDDTSCK